MKNLETIADELFNKIRGRFPNITVGNESAEVTNKPKEARFLSYYGLCITKVEKNATKAIPLCEKAVEKNIFHADLFCNLGKVYLQKQDRKKAYNAFIKGLSIDKRNKELINELKKMGIRKRPLFTFLPRENIINHLAGLLYHSLLKREKPVY